MEAAHDMTTPPCIHIEENRVWLGEQPRCMLPKLSPSFKLIREAATYFMVRDGAPRSVVNISSTSGIHGNAGQASYALAKAGLVGLSKTVAQEWGPEYGVRANSTLFFLCPILAARRGCGHSGPVL